MPWFPDIPKARLQSKPCRSLLFPIPISVTVYLDQAGTMPEMTLSEAAKWAGKGRPAIFKAIQKGKISARKNEAGEWQIDPSELARVYQPVSREHIQENTKAIECSTSDIEQAIAGKDRELALMREMLNAAREETADARRERDRWEAEAGKWQVQAENQTRLLTHQVAQETPIATAPVRRGLFARFRGHS